MTSGRLSGPDPFRPTTETEKLEKPMTLVTVNIPAIVDRLGNLKAVAADIADEQDTLKADLIEYASATGERGLEGQLFRATVSFANKSKTDWSAVLDDLCEAYGIPAAACGKVVLKHTEVAEGVPSVRVSARKGS